MASLTTCCIFQDCYRRADIPCVGSHSTRRLQANEKKQSAKEGNDKLTFIGMHPIQSISANDVANDLTQENGIPPKCVKHLENGLPPRVDLSLDTTLPIGKVAQNAPIQHQDVHQSRISQLELVDNDTAPEFTSMTPKASGIGEGKTLFHIFTSQICTKLKENKGIFFSKLYVLA